MSDRVIPKEEKAVKRIFHSWLVLIRNVKERYYLAKALDLFYALPALHQKNLLLHIVKEIPNTRWEALTSDYTQHIDAMRSILYYYTGTEMAGDPTRAQFADLLKGYLKSSLFQDALDNKEPEVDIDSESLIDLMEA